MFRHLPALFVATVALLSAACGGETSSPSPTDDTNEINKSGLQVFSCTTDKPIDGKITTLTFSIRNIENNKKVAIFDKDGKDSDDSTWVGVTPSESRLSELNDNITVVSGTRMLRISGDADGFFFVELALFKDSGYAKGFVRIEGPDPDEVGENAYSKIQCKITQKK